MLPKVSVGLSRSSRSHGTEIIPAAAIVPEPSVFVGMSFSRRRTAEMRIVSLICFPGFCSGNYILGLAWCIDINARTRGWDFLGWLCRWFRSGRRRCWDWLVPGWSIVYTKYKIVLLSRQFAKWNDWCWLPLLMFSSMSVARSFIISNRNLLGADSMTAWKEAWEPLNFSLTSWYIFQRFFLEWC